MSKNPLDDLPEESIEMSDKEFDQKLEESLRCIELSDIKWGPFRLEVEVCPDDKELVGTLYVFGVKVGVIKISGNSRCQTIKGTVKGCHAYTKLCVNFETLELSVRFCIKCLTPEQCKTIKVKIE